MLHKYHTQNSRKALLQKSEYCTAVNPVRIGNQEQWNAFLAYLIVSPRSMFGLKPGSLTAYRSQIDPKDLPRITLLENIMRQSWDRYASPGLSDKITPLLTKGEGMMVDLLIKGPTTIALDCLGIKGGLRLSLDYELTHGPNFWMYAICGVDTRSFTQYLFVDENGWRWIDLYGNPIPGEVPEKDILANLSSMSARRYYIRSISMSTNWTINNLASSIRNLVEIPKERWTDSKWHFSAINANMDGKFEDNKCDHYIDQFDRNPTQCVSTILNDHSPMILGKDCELVPNSGIISTFSTKTIDLSKLTIMVITDVDDLPQFVAMSKNEYLNYLNWCKSPRVSDKNWGIIYRCWDANSNTVSCYLGQYSNKYPKYLTDYHSW